MAWIKRNLYFVLSMVAGMALTGYCAYLFFYVDLSNNKAVNKDYEDDAASYDKARNKPPYPSPENIALVKGDLGQVKALVAELHKTFSPFPTPPQEDARGFSTYLEDTILDLKEQAASNSVGLPEDIAFGFTDLRHKFRFSPEHIPMYMQQLMEIKALCAVLYNARINSVESFRRVPVSTNDLFTTPTDTFAANMTITPMATFTPYKIEFRCFTPELAAVMEGLARSSNCFIVKNVVVKPADVKAEGFYPPAAAAAAPVTPLVAAPLPGQTPLRPPPGAAPPVAVPGQRPPRLPGGGAPPPPPPRLPRAPVAVAPAAPGSTVLPTILREKLLFITLSVDAVKLK